MVKELHRKFGGSFWWDPLQLQFKSSLWACYGAINCGRKVMRSYHGQTPERPAFFQLTFDFSFTNGSNRRHSSLQSRGALLLLIWLSLPMPQIQTGVTSHLMESRAQANAPSRIGPNINTWRSCWCFSFPPATMSLGQSASLLPYGKSGSSLVCTGDGVFQIPPYPKSFRGSVYSSRVCPRNGECRGRCAVVRQDLISRVAPEYGMFSRSDWSLWTCLQSSTIFGCLYSRHRHTIHQPGAQMPSFLQVWLRRKICYSVHILPPSTTPLGMKSFQVIPEG